LTQLLILQPSRARALTCKSSIEHSLSELVARPASKRGLDENSHPTISSIHHFSNSRREDLNRFADKVCNLPGKIPKVKWRPIVQHPRATLPGSERAGRIHRPRVDFNPHFGHMFPPAYRPWIAAAAVYLAEHHGPY
jgi:hypothetical protein